MRESRRPRILLADDHMLVAMGLSKLLEQDFELLGVKTDGRQLLAEVRRNPPDVVLLDISMPGLNGLEAARRIRAAFPQVKIVFVTVHSDLVYVAEAIRAGAVGYVLKELAASELREAIVDALNGELFLASTISRSALDEILKQPPGKPVLTDRQREILQLVAEGQSAKDIAFALRISIKTVEFHKSATMKKLNIHSVAGLTRYAMEHGIVPPDRRAVV